MPIELGDFSVGDVIHFHFVSNKADGTPITLSGSPVISAYKNGNSTEFTTGITLDVDYDSRTGFNHVAVDTASGYAAGDNISLTITTGTVDSVSVVGYVVARFALRAVPANVTEWLGTTPATPATAGVPSVDAITFDGHAPVQTSGKLWVLDGSGNAVMPAGSVTVGTNNDKTGYSLSQAFPANFSSLGIDGNGNLTGFLAVINSGQTGNALTSTTVQLASGDPTADTYAGLDLVINVSGVFQYRKIIAWTGTVATVDSPWIFSPQAGNAYYVIVANNPRVDSSGNVRGFDDSGAALSTAAGLNATSAGVLAAINASFAGTTSALAATNTGQLAALAATNVGTLAAIHASYAGTIAAISASAGGGSAPTVAQIDTQLSGTHGAGPWGPTGATGSVTVTESSGSDQDLTIEDDNNVGTFGATVDAFLKSDWDAGNRALIYRKDTTTTDVNGKWVDPMHLDPATYTFAAYKTGVFQTNTKEAIVS